MFKILQFATFSVFIARAWQHLIWDAPYRELLWNEKLMSGVIKTLTGMDWEAYVTSLEVNNTIEFVIHSIGIFYLLCALITLFIKKLPKIFQKVLLLGGFSLMFLAVLYCMEFFYSLGQFFEYSLQFGSPFFLVAFIRNKEILTDRFLLIIKIAIALAFSCHGLYALGFYPIPGQFLEMTMNILGLDEIGAKTFLNIAGILDFVISIGIFLPNKWAKPFLIYAIFWGFSTTIARIWANFHLEYLYAVLFQWVHESVMRVPHFLIPFFVLRGILNKL